MQVHGCFMVSAMVEEEAVPFMSFSRSYTMKA